jgi:hypothetical protein
MEVKQVLLLFLVVTSTFGEIFGKTQNSEVSRYIGRLIRDLNAKEPLQIHDVVLINLGKENRALNERIVRMIPDTNALMMPKAGIVIKDQRIRVASFVIIIVDVLDEVKLISSQKMA